MYDVKWSTSVQGDVVEIVFSTENADVAMTFVKDKHLEVDYIISNLPALIQKVVDLGSRNENRSVS